MARPSPYPAELRERAVRMVAEVRPNYPTGWAATKAVAVKLGIGSAETVRTWIRKAERQARRTATLPWAGSRCAQPANRAIHASTSSADRGRLADRFS
ncbi:hypothetical protein GCM10010377_81060 [Streptomyces viridiviolaceus]|nr:hypothetical protein GCM10010377_81060 [Streptomyces viridiviolaceus]